MFELSHRDPKGAWRPTLRLQIGLEDIEDLKADLAAGFKRLASYTPTAEPG